MAITFKTRHLPLSDGVDHFKGQLPDPPEWFDHDPRVKTRKRKSSTKRISKAKKAKGARTNGDRAVVHKRFDKITGQFVELVDLS